MGMFEDHGVPLLFVICLNDHGAYSVALLDVSDMLVYAKSETLSYEVS
jgi:hypothetical protein